MADQWPSQEEPERIVCVLYNTSKSKAGTQPEYIVWKKILKQLKARTDITKNIRPHLWHHACVTELSEHLADAQRCKYFEWVDGSYLYTSRRHREDDSGTQWTKQERSSTQ